MSIKDLVEKNKALPVYEQEVRAIKERFVQIAGEENYLREANFAMQLIQGNSVLAACKPESIRNAVLNVALCGITLNPALQYAHLVPRDGKCVLDFNYRGLIFLATKEGSISHMDAQVVYTFDTFEYEQGSNPSISYKMNLEPPVDMDVIGKSKKIWDYVVAAFSIATFANGQKNFIILPKWKLQKVWQTSKGKDNPSMPWNTWPEEQIRKTVIKYHIKTLPKNDGLANAIQLLNEEEGLDLKSEKNAQEVMKRFNKETENSILEEEIDPFDDKEVKDV